MMKSATALLAAALFAPCVLAETHPLVVQHKAPQHPQNVHETNPYLKHPAHKVKIKKIKVK